MMMWGDGYSWAGMLVMLVATLIGLALITLFVIALVWWLRPQLPPASAPPSSPAALEILVQRYARGEIDAATFTRMRGQIGIPTKPETDDR